MELCLEEEFSCKRSELHWKKLAFYSSAIEDDVIKYLGHDDGIVLFADLLCCIGDSGKD